jgi:hypothetical protein
VRIVRTVPRRPRRPGGLRARLAGLRRGDALDLLAGLLSAGLLALVYEGRPGPVRVLLALGFTFFTPGRAIVSHLPLLDGWSAVAMPVVLSLAVLTLLATVTLWAHAWRPLDLFQAEAWLSLGCLAAGVVRRRRRSRPDPAHQGSS